MALIVEYLVVLNKYELVNTYAALRHDVVRVGPREAGAFQQIEDLGFARVRFERCAIWAATVSYGESTIMVRLSERIRDSVLVDGVDVLGLRAALVVDGAAQNDLVAAGLCAIKQ